VTARTKKRQRSSPLDKKGKKMGNEIDAEASAQATRPSVKPVEFVGSAEEDIAAFPRPVKLLMGFAIYQAQIGQKHRAAKPLTGHKTFKGAGVIELVGDYDGDTYRAAYTVKLAGVVYVLHAFQKKATQGISTPKSEIEKIKGRLARAREHYEMHYVKKQKAV
jgi:phage-related protein